MSRARVESTAEIGAWQAYRRTFHDFSERVRHLQSLTTDPHPDRPAIEVALVEVEKARVVYDMCRDALAQHLLGSSRPRVVSPDASPEAHAVHARQSAELLCASAG